MTTKQKYLLLFMLLVSITVNARVYYSRANGNWSATSSWSTVSYVSATNTGTFPSTNDTAYVGGGFTIYLNATLTTNSINVGDGSSGGTLEYLNSASYSLTVSTNVTVNTDGTIIYNTNSGPGRTHQLILYGNLVNNGTIDFSFDANDYVNLSFMGALNAVVSGNGSYQLSTVMLNKTSVNYSVEVTSTTFAPALTGTFSAFVGKWIHNNSSTFNINPSSNFQINAAVVFEVDAGTVRFANSSTTLTLQGSLIVSGGTVTVGSTAGTVGIRTDQSGSTVAALVVSSGSLTVYGTINYKSGSGNKPFRFTQSGGTVSLHSGTTGNSSEVLKITDIANSEFNMSGGTLIFNKPNLAGSSSIDMDVCGTNGTVTVTGGEIQFGTASTAAGATFNFKPYQSITFPGIVVSGPTSSGTTLCPSNASNSTDTMRFLYLQIDQGSTFDNRSYSGSVGDDKPLVLTSDKSGIAFYNAGTFTPRTGTVVFSGSSNQIINGTGAQTFYNMTMSSTSTVTLNQMLTISNNLTLTNGLIISSSSAYPTLGTGATTTVGNASSYVSGPMRYQMASTGPLTLNFPIGLGGAWRPNVLTVTHSSAAIVYYYVQLVNSAASALPYTLPGTLSRVSGVRYYQFVRSGASNFTSATMQIYYGTDDGVTQPSTLRVAQASGSNWLNQGGTGTAAGSGTITSASFNSFTTIYALGNSTGGSNPLPVELTSFTASKKDKFVQLNWVTASELNNNYFEVMRSSDGVFFESIGRVNGAGTTSQIHAYEFRDDRPLAGYNFYRLHQIDYDGTVTASMTRSVNFLSSQIVVYPSLSDGRNVKVTLPADTDETNVKLISSSGQIIMESKVEVGQKEVSFPDLPNGSYRALIRVNGEEYLRPLIVVN